MLCSPKFVLSKKKKISVKKYAIVRSLDVFELAPLLQYLASSVIPMYIFIFSKFQ